MILDDEAQTITLPRSKAVVRLKGFLTMGEAGKIKNAIRKGAKISFGKVGLEPRVESFDFEAEDESQMLALEMLVQEVKEPDLRTHPFDRAWFNDLHEDDGNLIVETVNAIRRPKAPSPAAES